MIESRLEEHTLATACFEAFEHKDGIITVVDAKHCLQHLHEEKPEGVENEAVEQLAFADRIIVNKTDLVRELSWNVCKIPLQKALHCGWFDVICVIAICYCLFRSLLIFQHPLEKELRFTGHRGRAFRAHSRGSKDQWCCTYDLHSEPCLHQVELLQFDVLTLK